MQMLIINVRTSRLSHAPSSKDGFRKFKLSNNPLHQISHPLSVVDRHHLDADPYSIYHPDEDPDADPDSDFLFDADAYLNFHPFADLDPDPDPSFKKGSNP
jgi:hypothetical protein